MEHHICCLISKQELLGVYKTIYLFLENQNFRETCEALKKECASFGCAIPDISGSVKIVKPTKSTQYAESEVNFCPECQSESFMLESSFRLKTPSPKTTQIQYLENVLKPSKATQCVPDNANFCYGPQNDSMLENPFCENRRPGGATQSMKSSKSIQCKDDDFCFEDQNEFESTFSGNAYDLGTPAQQFSATKLQENNDLHYKANARSLSNTSLNELPKYNEHNCYNGIYKTDNTNQGFNDKKHQELLAVKKKFNNLREEHKKLLAVTSELTNALQHNILGQTRNYHCVLDQCKTIYPTLFVSQKHAEGDFKRHSSAKTQNEGGDISDNEYNMYIKISRERISENEDNTTIILESLKLDDNIIMDLDNEAREITNVCSSGRKDVENLLDSLLSKVTQSPRYSDNHNNTSAPMNTPISPKSLAEAFEEQDDNRNLNQQGSLNTTRKVLEVFPLDYEKIKDDLFIANSDTRLALLQALRWRLTQSTPEIQKEVLSDYIQYDLLNLMVKEKNLTEGFFQSSDMSGENVFEAFSRLINTFACFTQGRDYLMSQKSLLNCILNLQLFDHQQIFWDFSRDMLLATLQKLSLRKPVRNHMIVAGLIDQLLEFLNKFHTKISEYCLEYASALLMNLSLEPEAREKLALKPFLLVNLLKKLLKARACCVPYVNGILFSVLDNDEINKVAKAQHLDKAIQEQIESNSNDSHIKKQLDIILKTRFAEDFEKFVCDSGREVTEEVDMLENELDEDDVMICNLPVGENLLQRYRLQAKIPKSDAMKDLPRPSTPATVRIERNKSGKEQKKDKVQEQSNKIEENLPSTLWPMSSPTRIFNEETEQYYRRPRMGMFEPIKSSLFTTPKKTKNRGPKEQKPLGKRKTRNSFPSFSHNSMNPLCYLEVPCKLNSEGESRYSCGCYDAMKQEIIGADLPENLDNRKNNTGWKGTAEKHYKSKMDYSNRTACTECGEQICSCAFESRPKILRTPLH